MDAILYSLQIYQIYETVKNLVRSSGKFSRLVVSAYWIMFGEWEVWHRMSSSLMQYLEFCVVYFIIYHFYLVYPNFTEYHNVYRY